MNFDGETRVAKWDPSLHTDRYRDRGYFGYVVQEGDLDSDGPTFSANAIDLAGGFIRDAAGNDAILNNSAVGADDHFKVDAVAPTVSSIAITSDPGDDDTYGTGEKIEVTVTFSENMSLPISITCSSDVVHCKAELALNLANILEIVDFGASNLGGTARTADYQSHDGAEVVYAYTVQAGDTDDNGIAIGANKLTGQRIRDAAGRSGEGINDADLSHDAVADDSGHKVSGTSSPLALSGDTTINYAENGEGSVATYTLSGSDGAITWSLSGDDSDDFSLSGGSATTRGLSFTSSPNYEDPTDADTDNQYDVTIQASDGSNTSTLQITIIVTNVRHDADELPVITGTAQVGETLTVDTSPIPDTDQHTTFGYAWIRTDGDTDTNIDGATSSSYTLAANDEGKTIKVLVGFRTTGGERVRMTSVSTEVVVAEGATPNTPATGLPTISGTAQVGQKLTVSTSGIADADGLTNASFGGTWSAGEGYIRVFIAPGFDLSYIASRRDAGMTLHITVNFEDDAGETHFLTSAKTSVVAATSPAAPENLAASATDSGDVNLSWEAPTWDMGGEIDGEPAWGDGGSDITGYVVQWKEESDSWDTAADVSEASVTGTSHTIRSLTGGADYSIRVLAVNSIGRGLPSDEATVTVTRSSRGSLPPQQLSSDASLSSLTLSDVDFGTFASDTTSYTASVYRSVSETTVTPTANHSGASYVIKLGGVEDSDGTVSLSVGSNVITVEVTAEDGNATQAYSVTVTREENTPAAGKPKIAARYSSKYVPARVTQTLRAHTSNIRDEEGIENATFSCQWISSDGSTDTDISGATSYTYTLQPAEEGQTIKVRVSFTDDAGNSESVISEATMEVVAEDAGICSRTPIVREQIMDAIWRTGVRDCGFVTDTHLAGVTDWFLFVGDLANTIPPSPRIDSFKAGDFAGLSSLERLIIRDTRITDLPNGVFTGLSGLRELKIYENHLATLGSDVFDGLTLVTDLDLQDNAIASLPSDVFDTLLVLETLNLRDNDLTSLPSGLLDNQSELEELDLVGNGLTGLPEEIFDELTDLERLYLSGNNLSSLSTDLFSELENLETLSLWRNSLEDLPNGIFSELNSLESLSLNGNDLDDLPDGVFDDLSGLKSLYLAENQLDDLPDDLFSGWTSLERLTLEDNPGAPFVFGLTLVENDDGDVVVNVSKAAPFDISLTLEAYGGALDSTEVTLSAGGTSTDGTTVTGDGNGAATVRVLTAEFDMTRSNGTVISRGDPLTLPNTDDDNNLATGQPTISGTATVGRTLTASKSDIADGDGLTNPTFEYQWVSSDGTTDEDIDGATSSTYEIVASDLDQEIKVLVKFEDDDGNHEIVTSEATDAVGEETNVPATGQPVIVGETLIMSGHTLTVDLSGVSDENGMPDSGYSYSWLCTDDDREYRCSSRDYLTPNRWIRGETVKVSVSFTDNGGNSETVVSETAGRIKYPPSPAAGTPLVNGIPRVGVELRMGLTTISDSNGRENFYITRRSEWQADGTKIEGSGGSSRYTVQSTDVGKRITYVANFEDDDGYPERLESAPTSVVVAADSANSPAAGAPRVLKDYLSGTIGEAYWIRVGDTLLASTTTNARHSSNRITDADGLTNATFTFQWMRGDGTTFTDIPGATGERYLLMDADEGEKLKVKVSFSDDAGNEEEMFSAPSGTVRPLPNTPENNPAEGTATISGTARVGETLTVDVSGITDADGMDDSDFQYQWFTDYDADRSGGIWYGVGFVNTWTVERSYVGKELTMRWLFQDDLGNYESGTVTTATVVAAVPGEPRAVRVEPGGTGELDVSWVRPDSDGGSEITGYTVQWKEASGSWDTATDVSEATVTVTSYTITSLRIQVEYAVRVIATNSAGDGPPSGEVKETADAQISQQKEASENTPATGAPAISGIPEAGRSLNADTSSISDDDGLDNATFVYQWLSDDTDISGATGSAYILADSDQGKAIKVRVSFTDDAGNDESLTSEALVVPVRPHGLTATASDGDVVLSWNPPVGFSYLYDYQILRNRPELGETEPLVYVNTGNAETTYTDTDVEPGVLYVYRVKAASYFGRFTEASEPAEVRTAESTPVVNTPATGSPTISGNLVVGQTLSVDTSAIEDADGLDKAQGLLIVHADGEVPRATLVVAPMG